MKTKVILFESIIAILFLVSCGTSEKFVQDDVYASKTPMVPLGTDFSDATDYAAFAMKKDKAAENTVYANASPRDRFDRHYASWMGYFVPRFCFSYGFSELDCQLYYGVYYRRILFTPGSLNRPAYYPGMGFYSGYDTYGFYSYGYPSFGYSPFTYNMYNYGNVYNNNNPYPTQGNWSPTNKPNIPSSISSLSAGTSKGRYGSTSSGTIDYYTNGMKQANQGRTMDKVSDVSVATPNSRSSVTYRTATSPEVARVNNTGVIRPNSSVSSQSGPTRVTYNNGTGSVGRTNTPNYNNSTPRVRTSEQPVYRQNNVNTTPTRSSSPSFNASPSSSPAGRSSGGSISGGRR